MISTYYKVNILHIIFKKLALAYSDDIKASELSNLENNMLRLFSYHYILGSGKGIITFWGPWHYFIFSNMV